MSGNNLTKPDNNSWTIIKLLQWAASYFKTHDIDSPRATGEILLAHALKCERIDLYLKFDQPLLGDELKTFKILVQRRIKREPVAYILGVKEFWSLDLEVTEDVLIPRPETECLVEAALEILARQASSQSWRILDLGTGSGAIAIAPLLSGTLDVAGKVVVCVLSGGNIETVLLRDILIEFTNGLCRLSRHDGPGS